MNGATVPPAPIGATEEEWDNLSSNPGFLPDLLPVCCDTGAPISPRSTLKELGKVPSLVGSNGQARGISNWSNRTTTIADVAGWRKDRRLGICVQTRNHKVFDVDVADKELANRIEDILRPLIAEMAGMNLDDVPLRWRDNSSKFAILVACGTVMPKRVLKLKRGSGKVEFLGNGQHCVVAGTHPSGARIHWECFPDKPPPVTDSQVDVIWSHLRDKLGDLIESASGGAPVPGDDFMAGNEPRLGMSLEEIEQTLNKLDSGMSRDSWVRVGMAIHHETEGDDSGFEVWLDWSCDAPNFVSREDVETQWSSFDRRRGAGRTQVTMASVIRMAKDATLGLTCARAYSPGPVPLDEDRTGAGLPSPFPGFMAQAVAIALDTAQKQQPDLTTLGVLTAMASVCPGTFCYPDGMRLNLYALAVAPTVAGKGHVISVATAIVRAGEAMLLGDFASGAGVEDALVTVQGMLSIVDEIAHTLAARGERGNHHLKGVEQQLLRLYSASNGIYTTRAKAGCSPRSIENPCLNLLGFAVPVKLGEALSDGDVVSGLLNRMLIAVGDGSAPPRLGVRRRFELTSEMKTRLGEVVKAGRLGAVISVSGEVQAAIDELATRLHLDMMELPEEAAERLLLGRTLEKALRIAGLLSVYDQPDGPELTLEHLDWGVRFARASDAIMLRFIREHMHGGKVQADAAKVMTIVAALLRGDVRSARPSEIAALDAGWAPTSLILRTTRFSAKQLSEVIDHLGACGNLVCSKFEHRPAAGAASRISVVGFPTETG